MTIRYLASSTLGTYSYNLSTGVEEDVPINGQSLDIHLLQQHQTTHYIVFIIEDFTAQH